MEGLVCMEVLVCMEGADPLTTYGQTAVGMYPTGMHSCFCIGVVEAISKLKYYIFCR